MPKEKSLELVRIPLSQIKPDPKNAKDHDVGLIIESFKRFGYVNPMVLNSDDFLLAGHGRRKGLIAMKSGGDAPPKNIEAEGDEWIVPVGIGNKFSKREATAYRLVDNRSTEQGGYDEPQLLENLMELSKNGGLEATGYDLEDVDRLFQLLNPDLEEVQVSDEAEKLQSKWKTKSGQLWEIGRHRLLCGDSTKDLEGLALSGDWSVVTDPPYGIGLDTNYSKIKGSAKSPNSLGYEYDAVIGDDKPFDFSPFSEWKAEEQFWFGADYYARQLPENGSWFVWIKRDEAGSEMIGNDFELCWSKTKHKRRALRIRWVGWAARERNEKRAHPTQKPIELMGWFIERHCVGTVVDPFLGSGTTMVAAEQLNRTCYGMEIEPKYVAVTLERMSTMGLEPELLS